MRTTPLLEMEFFLEGEDASDLFLHDQQQAQEMRLKATCKTFAAWTCLPMRKKSISHDEQLLAMSWHDVS